MKRTLLKQAYICTCDNTLVKKDVLFDETAIIEIADEIKGQDAEVIDAKDWLLTSGLIDAHVHLREPGYEQKETIESGTMAAAHGGFTTIMAMPNVVPVPDDPTVMMEYRKYIEEHAHVHVIPYASITKGEKGKEPVAFAALKQMGITAFSDDGVGVADDNIMRKAMQESAKEDVLLVAHTEDMRYRKEKACIHEGIKSKELQVIGIPSACEYEQIKRDLALVEATHAHYHICHMSAKESVELLAQAKAKGLDVSGEVTVHHLLLNETDVKNDANYKMNPPLRSQADQKALIAGLKSGVIDFIANDHAPHTEREKAKGLVEAPFGIVSLETAFPLLYTYLVKKEIVTLRQLLDWMGKAVAQRFHLSRIGELQVGYASDLLLIDLHRKYQIEPQDFYSKGKNTPFKGWEVYGKVMMTFVNGKLVYKEETI